MENHSDLVKSQLRDLGLANREAIVLDEKEDRRYAHIKPGDEEKFLIVARPKQVDPGNEDSLNSWRKFSEDNKARICKEAEYDPVAKADAEMYGGQLHRLRRQIDIQGVMMGEINLRNGKTGQDLLEKKHLRYQRIQEAEAAAMDEEYQRKKAQMKPATTSSRIRPGQSQLQKQQNGTHKTSKPEIVPAATQNILLPTGPSRTQRPYDIGPPMANTPVPKQAIWNLSTKRVPPKSNQIFQSNNLKTSGRENRQTSRSSSSGGNFHPRITLSENVQLADPDDFLNAFSTLVKNRSTTGTPFSTTADVQIGGNSAQVLDLAETRTKSLDLIQRNDDLAESQQAGQSEGGSISATQKATRNLNVMRSDDTGLESLSENLLQLREQQAKLEKDNEDASSQLATKQNLLEKAEKRLKEIEGSHCPRCSGNCPGIWNEISRNSIDPSRGQNTPKLDTNSENSGAELVNVQITKADASSKNPFAKLSISVLKEQLKNGIASFGSGFKLSDTSGTNSLASKRTPISPEPNILDTAIAPKLDSPDPNIPQKPPYSALKSSSEIRGSPVVPQITEEPSLLDNTVNRALLGPVLLSQPFRAYVRKALAIENQVDGVSLTEIQARLKSLISSISQRGDLDFTQWNKMPLPQELIRQEKALAEGFEAKRGDFKKVHDMNNGQQISTSTSKYTMQVSSPETVQHKAPDVPTAQRMAGLKSSRYAPEFVPIRSQTARVVNSMENAVSSSHTTNIGSGRISYSVNELLGICSKYDLEEIHGMPVG